MARDGGRVGLGPDRSEAMGIGYGVSAISKISYLDPADGDSMGADDFIRSLTESSDTAGRKAHKKFAQARFKTTPKAKVIAWRDRLSKKSKAQL